jgi:outer membrane protein OmpA-like peptidoglycan-associated protein
LSRQKVPKPEEKKIEVPAYIVTFSDMVTLLLTFFVMLLTLASVQDDEMFNISRDSFVTSINTYGLGVLIGKKMAPPDYEHDKHQYFINNPDENFHGRTIDAREENLRRAYKKLTDDMSTMTSQIVSERTDFSVTSITFAPGKTNLNKAAMSDLREFAANVQLNSTQEAIKLYVLGLSRDEQTEKEQWITSALRAQAVADFLRKRLPSKSRYPVFSWGAGPGGEWVTRDSAISEQSQILIAILRN